MFSDSQHLGGGESIAENKGVKKALIIAVSEYDHMSAMRQLPFCKNDGQKMYEMLRSQGYIIPENRALIGRVDGGKLRDVILDFLLKDAGPKDTLLVYFSGHGLPDGFGHHYLVSSDTDPDYPDFHGFSFEDLEALTQKSSSQRIVTILDCCYSGAAEAKGSAEDSAKSGRAKIDRVFAEGDGKCVLASSLGDQSSFKMKDADYSLFSYFLIEGLNGAGGETVNGDGYVTASALGNYVFERMVENTRNQKPVTKTSMSGDIILAYHPEIIPKKESPISTRQVEPENPKPTQRAGLLKAKTIGIMAGGVVGVALLIAFFALSGHDTVKPSVAIVSPSQDSTVSGNVTITASSSDNARVTNINIFSDGTMIKSIADPSGTESLTWDTLGLKNGVHTLKAVAYDGGGNSAETSVGVNVNNPASISSPSAKPELAIANLGAKQATNFFYPIVPGTTARSCGVLENGPGCDFGTLNFEIGNTGTGDAKNCIPYITEAYDATGSHDGSMVLASSLGHHEEKVQANPFDIPGQQRLSESIDVKYPYTGSYSFSGSILCDNASVDIKTGIQISK